MDSQRRTAADPDSRGALHSVLARRGTYHGAGMWAEAVPVHGTLTIASALEGLGAHLGLVLRSDAGATLHSEQALLAPDPHGQLSLWTLHTSVEGVYCHPLRTIDALPDGGLALHLGLGDLRDRSILRTELVLELHADGRVSHRRSVGVPGADVFERSRLLAAPGGGFDVWHIALPVSDLERSVAFYCGRLGFTLLGRDEYPSKRQAFVCVPAGGFTLELFQPLGRWAQAAPKRPDHVAFECEDLAAFRTRIAPDAEIDTFDNGVQLLALDDPDGVELHFFQGRAIYEQTTLRRPGHPT